eukprot:TRINITY_DN18810_c0_g1_i1.p1 TRINITY_DN18810_c0_g1~~TRINITY_DN18810_c0_g1_i1.p1  ORF type:complete len:193 (+),score=1.47 TRINITY_DN18810_c0_g1_i1:1-579(+)
MEGRSNSHCWGLLIKVFAGILIILGVLTIVQSLINGFTWAGFVLGPLYILVGILGEYSTFSSSIKAAKTYFYGLIFVTFVASVINIVFIIIMDVLSYQDLCKRQLWSIDEFACDTQKTHIVYIIGGVMAFFCTLFCCIGYLCCARSYYKALAKEAACIFKTGVTHGSPPSLPEDSRETFVYSPLAGESDEEV